MSDITLRLLGKVGDVPRASQLDLLRSTTCTPTHGLKCHKEYKSSYLLIGECVPGCVDGFVDGTVAIVVSFDPHIYLVEGDKP